MLVKIHKTNKLSLRTAHFATAFECF